MKRKKDGCGNLFERGKKGKVKWKMRKCPCPYGLSNVLTEVQFKGSYVLSDVLVCYSAETSEDYLGMRR